MPKLERKLGLWVAVSIVVGSVVGSSIFMKPATMAAQLGSPSFIVLVWVIAGIVSILGAMINAEIGAMVPETGGQYVYFRKMYGNFFSYLYGWASLIVINTAAIGAITFVFAQFSETFFQLPHFNKATEMSVVWHIPWLGDLFPLANAGVKTLAILLIVIITWVNYRSAKSGGAVQVFFTVLKVVALLLLICFLFGGDGNVSNFVNNPPSFNPDPWMVFTGFIAASSGALAAYDGWNNLGFISGELKDPGRNIPKGLILGLVGCMLLYILTTLAYLYLMPVDEMKNSTLVAADAMKKVSGMAGGGFIAILVMVSSAGATNGNVLPCARITFAMAEDGNFWRWGAKVHPRFQTPSNALWLQCIIACLFVVTGSFDMLADLFVFVSWIFYGFGAFGIFILRRKMPDADRPYKMKGYPILPLVFIAFSILYFTVTIYNDVSGYLNGTKPMINSILGLILILSGVPFYYYFRHKYRAR